MQDEQTRQQQRVPYSSCAAGARKSIITDPAIAALLKGAPAQQAPLLLPSHPEFLTAGWFRQENASGLRHHLRYLVFKLMLDQVMCLGLVAWGCLG